MGRQLLLAVCAALELAACGMDDHQLESDSGLGSAMDSESRTDAVGPRKDAGTEGKDSSAKDATGSREASSADASDDSDASDAAIMQPLSCVPGGLGRTNCGAGGSDSESCCTSLEVEGGTYFRTYGLSDGGVFETAADGGPTGEADRATVGSFRLDKYLVTVGRFRQFVAAWNNGAGYTPAVGSGKHTSLNGGQGLANSGSIGSYELGWVATDDSNIAPTDANLACDEDYATWTTSVANNENLPINCETRYEAYAFCIWDGGFLPSDAEWEYAATGGSRQREYPWGSTPPGAMNQYAIYGCNYPSGSGSCSGPTNIAPVGTATLGAGLWNQLDLAGDLTEWNLDWYATYVNPCTNCAYLTATSAGGVARGGLFIAGTSNLLPTVRFGDAPSGRYSGIGFRCARTP